MSLKYEPASEPLHISVVCCPREMEGAGLSGEVEEVLGSLLRDKALQDVESCIRKVDVRLPGKGNSNSHGARPVHLIITMLRWIRTNSQEEGWVPTGAIE